MCKLRQLAAGKAAKAKDTKRGPKEAPRKDAKEAKEERSHMKTNLTLFD